MTGAIPGHQLVSIPLQKKFRTKSTVDGLMEILVQDLEGLLLGLADEVAPVPCWIFLFSDDKVFLRLNVAEDYNDQWHSEKNHVFRDERRFEVALPGVQIAAPPEY